MKAYLVTGGAGFLGSHLCERLLRIDETCHVIVVDNLSSSDGSNIDYLYNTGFKRRFHFLQGDVSDVYAWNEVQHRKRFDTIDGIFNLACPASPPFYQNMPIETTLTSVLGAHYALEYATKWGAKILQTSTSEVYGNPEVSPQPESYYGKVNCFGPRACYDEGKRAAEALFFDYQKQRGTDIRVVRIFNTYGPHMLANDGRVVTNFINQALRGEDITIYGDGSQSRSFCYVEDLINAIMIVWKSDYKAPVNIGNPNEFTMLELAQKVIEITGSKSKLVFQDLPVDDPLQRCPDITLAKSLGWVGPRIQLDEGLRNTVQYFSYKALTQKVFK
jgi:UDP-glucuronate decarboxylase